MAPWFRPATAPRFRPATAPWFRPPRPHRGSAAPPLVAGPSPLSHGSAGKTCRSEPKTAEKRGIAEIFPAQPSRSACCERRGTCEPRVRRRRKPVDGATRGPTRVSAGSRKTREESGGTTTTSPRAMAARKAPAVSARKNPAPVRCGVLDESLSRRGSVGDPSGRSCDP